MCYEAVELPSLPAAAAAHCRSPQGGMEGLLESLDGISGITLLWGSCTAEGQLLVWEQE